MLSIYVRFTLHPAKKSLFMSHLTDLMKTMSKEPSYVNAVLSEDPNAPDDLFLFEVWNGSKEEWIQEQPQKPYRAEHDNATKDLVASKEVRFLTPIAIQGMM